MTRRGKIARLPRALRDELNLRIEDGETGARIVDWLNGREDVQELLKIHFGSRPINEQNLSDWRKGGYADWQEQQATFELANGLMDEAAERKDIVTDGRLADHVGDMAALMLAKMIRALRRMEDGPEQWETALKVVREVVRLRKSDREHEDALRRRETHERYETQEWVRTRASFERTEEKVDQLIMRKLVAAGRGRMEDIPASARPGRAKVRRAERASGRAMEGRGEEGASTSTSMSTSTSKSTSTSMGTSAEEGGRASGEMVSPPEAGEDGVCKTDALQEGASQMPATDSADSPQVPQESSRSIKFDRRSES